MNKNPNYRVEELDFLDEIHDEWKKYIQTIGIVRLDDINRYFILQELFAGNALEFLRYHPKLLHRKAVINVFCQLSKQLSYLHNCGIAHRDLKLENILLTPAEGRLRAVIIDFELSKKAREADVLVGTHFYWPPEYWQYMSAADKSKVKIDLVYADIWSLGMIFGELLYPQEPAPWLALKTEGSLDIFDELISELKNFSFVYPNTANPLIESMENGYPLKDHDLASALIHDMLHFKPRTRPDAEVVKSTCNYISNLENASASNPQQSKSC